MRDEAFDPAGRIDWRTQAELVAMRYLAATDLANMKIRFDDIQMIRVGDDRAMLRHVKDCLAN